jgi:hypothetical protein
VIGPSGNVRVLVATKPVDFRKGAEGLAALVRETMRIDPFSGVVYVFRAKRADRVKLIFWDGTGVVLVAKRLETASLAGRQSTMASCGSARPSSRHCWKDWIGGAFMSHGGRRSRPRRAEPKPRRKLPSKTIASRRAA